MEYERYLRRVWDTENAEGRRFALPLELVNGGTAPAEDIDIDLHVPDGCVVFDEDNMPDKPKEPRRPVKPQTVTEMLPDLAMPMASIYPSIPNVDFSPSNVSSPLIKRTTSYEVNFHVSRLKHGFVQVLPLLYCEFENNEAARSLQINYVLHAANIPEPTEGTIHIAVERHAAD